MIQRIVCRTLIGRDEELSALEDFLLAASGGEGRMVLLAGEAGVGKTRLSTELAARARKLGFVVMSGGCSEAELSLPYLPFVQAIGNWLSGQDAAALTATLGPSAAELGHLFPQLAAAAPPAAVTDPSQAKLRLFEAIASLLAVPAREHGLVLMIEDIHWADGSTRELLEHLTRRAPAFRMLVVATYRSDELDRRHPLMPTLQAWRRSGLAETIAIGSLSPQGVARMIASIFEEDEVSEEFRDLMHDRTEGNPFVLEEMLKDAIERGDIYRTDGRWERRPIQELRIPDTVRHAILFRLERLDPALVPILQAAAVLGRSFDYPTLVAVSGAAESTVQAALDAAIAQQLIEEDREAAGLLAYRWRHALTQEAISTDLVLPRRQELHSRAADVLTGGPESNSVDVAQHLLAAGRFEEALPVCLRAAEEAEAAVAYGLAVSLYEHILPHVKEARDRARIACLVGRNLWANAETARAEQWLARGTAELEAMGEAIEAARYRLVLGRCRWELSRPDLARQDFEAARDVLEREGPSADLAMAWIRIAGMPAFELDYESSLQASQHAVDIARAAGADFERTWAEVFLLLGLVGTGRVQEGLELAARLYKETLDKGYVFIAQNLLYNEAWERTHLMLGGLEDLLERGRGLPTTGIFAVVGFLGTAYIRLALGDLRGSLRDAREGRALVERLQAAKFTWRYRVHQAQVLLEMGRVDEAAELLPPASARTELQDIVYDAPARIRLLLAQGGAPEAAAEAQDILAGIEGLSGYRETLSVGVEAFVAAGRLEDALALVEAGRAARTPAGMGFQHQAEGMLQLAEGRAEEAAEELRAAVAAAGDAGFVMEELRARSLLGEALARSGRGDEARAEFQAVVTKAGEIGAELVRRTAVARAEAARIELEAAPEPVVEERPEAVAVGERMVTTVFADVRRYTEFAATATPEELAERMTRLHGWAQREIERHGGVVDKFAGDAVMATFNVSGDRVDHPLEALKAALAMRDKAALLDLELGIGIAVGPAVVGSLVPGANVSVLGASTNLAARLQSAAQGGEIVLSEETHPRVEGWLKEREMQADREELELKGFDQPQTGYRLHSRALVQ